MSNVRHEQKQQATMAPHIARCYPAARTVMLSHAPLGVSGIQNTFCVVPPAMAMPSTTESLKGGVGQSARICQVGTARFPARAEGTQEGTHT